MKRKGRGPGKNNLPPELRARRQSGPHRAAPPDRIARVRALVDALGLAAMAEAAGTRPGQVGPILRGERSIGVARLEAWEHRCRALNT
jgi:hypothetical protein